MDSEAVTSQRLNRNHRHVLHVNRVYKRCFVNELRFPKLVKICVQPSGAFFLFFPLLSPENPWLETACEVCDSQQWQLFLETLYQWTFSGISLTRETKQSLLIYVPLSIDVLSLLLKNGSIYCYCFFFSDGQ